MLPPVERIPLPSVTITPDKRPFPFAAILAPMGMAVVLWLVTSSPFALLFAMLGPVLALGSRWDARRGARRTLEREIAAAREQLAALDAELEERLAERGRQLWRAVPAREGGGSAPERGWLLGRGDVPSRLELVANEEHPALADDYARLRERTAFIADAPVIVDDVELAVIGPSVLRSALARSLVLQAVQQTPVGEAQITVPVGEEWARNLPGRCVIGDEWSVSRGDHPVLVVHTSERHGRVVRLDAADGEHPPCEGVRAWRPSYLARAEAAGIAQRMREHAMLRGWHDAREIPATVDLAELLREAATRDTESTAAVIGRDAEGAVALDLERSGPHALVAGTTGSGKSELLVSWVLALAAARPPEQLVFLLVDFKGGAAFAPLQGVPHVVGIVDDLDQATANRAVDSLRAELRRREQVLAEHRARDIRELRTGTLPRLVIVVDEFAALVAEGPELHEVFSDVAARGRSLGMHLILGTQRPAGIVRDTVLANITIRVCLRVLDAADSTSMVGSPDAVELPANLPGRAVLRDEHGIRTMHVARATPELIARVSQRWQGHRIPDERPWCDPLPELLVLNDSVRGNGGLVIGMVDLPREQRQEPLELDPWQTGALLVVGATGSGRSCAMRALAAAADADTEVRWIVRDAAELWAALSMPPARGRSLVVVDDLDMLLGLVDLELRAELVDLLVRTARDARRSGVAIVASAHGTGGTLQGADVAFEQRLLLRMSSREDHLLAGGGQREYRSDRRPGSAIWHTNEAQLALVEREPDVWRAAVTRVTLAAGTWALVTPHPERWLRRLRAADVKAAPVDSPTTAATVLVGDVESWLVEHLALQTVRREGRLVLHQCTRADLRALTRSRRVPPPVGADEAWLVDAGEITRVRIREAEQ